MDAEDLPPGWAWATLSEIADAPESVSPARAFADRQAFKYVDLSAVNSGQITKAQEVKPSEAPSRARQMIRAGDTLFSCVRVYLENIAFVTTDFDGQIASTAYAVLRPRDGIDARYLYWQARQPAFIKAMTDAQRGNSPPAVQEDDVRGARVPIAPSAEQTRIAAAVDALLAELDEAEAALARAREGVAQFRASMLHAACTGQLTAAWRAARPPTKTGADLLRRVLAERRTAWERTERARLEARGTLPRGDAWKARYVEPAAPDLSGMPDLPDGWAWASLDQLARSSSYGSSVKCDADATGLAVLRIPNVQTGEVNWSKLKYATADLGLAESDLLAVGDLLIVRTNGSPNLVGRAGLVEATPSAPSYFASYLIRYRLAGAETLQRWVATAFGSGLIRVQVGRFAATSAGQYNISQTNLSSFAIPVPSEAEMTVALDLLREAPMRADDWSLNAELASLRQSILHAAFTGRLVSQDPTDEPATALLARLRGTSTPARRARRRTPAEVPA